MSNLTKFVMALVGLVATLLVARRQLFLFVVMTDPSPGIAGGNFHLWGAAIAGVIACVAGGLMFLFFGRHEDSKWSKVVMTPTGPLLTPVAIRRATSSALAPFNLKQWALANSWLVTQPDDRTPMDGSVSDSGQTSSGQRSFARRTHQLMFKKWSQERHES